MADDAAAAAAPEASAPGEVATGYELGFVDSVEDARWMAAPARPSKVGGLPVGRMGTCLRRKRGQLSLGWGQRAIAIAGHHPILNPTPVFGPILHRPGWLLRTCRRWISSAVAAAAPGWCSSCRWVAATWRVDVWILRAVLNCGCHPDQHRRYFPGRAQLLPHAVHLCLPSADVCRSRPCWRVGGLRGGLWGWCEFLTLWSRCFVGSRYSAATCRATRTYEGVLRFKSTFYAMNG